MVYGSIMLVTKLSDPGVWSNEIMIIVHHVAVSFFGFIHIENFDRWHTYGP